MANRYKFITKLAKVIGWIFLSLLILIAALILFIRSPWGQDIVVQKATTYLAGKTQTAVSIERLFITFSGNVYLDGLYMEDQEGDTLIYSGKLETGVRFLPLIRSGKIHVSKLEWSGLRANVERDSTGKFNFDFIIDAFGSGKSDNADYPVPDQDAVNQQDSTGYPEIDLGPILISDAKLVYVDEFMGLDANILLGELGLSVNKLDLNKMDFYISEIELKNTDLSYIQEKPFESEEPDEPSQSGDPVLILDRLAIEGVNVIYQSIPDQMTADIQLGELFLSLPEANMLEKRILLDQLELHRSDFDIAILQTSTQGESEPTSQTDSNFEWPDWEIELGAIHFSENDFSFRTSEEVPARGYFNPSSISVSDLTLKANGVALGEEKAVLDLEAFSFKEYSGFELREGTFRASIDQKTIKLRDLRVQTGNSRILANLEVGYQNIDQLIDNYLQADLNLTIAEIVVGLQDAYFFEPSLRNDPNIAAIGRKSLTGNFELSGRVNDLNINNAQLAWGGNTRVGLEGIIKNVLDMDSLWVDIDPIAFETNRADMEIFLTQLDSSMTLPETIQLDVAVKGGMKNMQANANLIVPEGEIYVDADYAFDQVHKLESKISIVELDLQGLLSNPNLGVVSYYAELTALGTSVDDLVLNLNSEFYHLNLYGYDYDGLEFDAEIDGGVGGVSLSFKDENLDVGLLAKLDLDSINSKIEVDLDLRGVDLNALNLSGRELKARIHYKVNWEGNLDNFELRTILEEGTLVLEDRPILIEGFDIVASVGDTLTVATLQSSIMNLELESNSAPDQAFQAFSNYFGRVLGDSLLGYTADSLVLLKLNVDIPRSQVLEQLILPGLESWETFKLSVEFDELGNTFDARIDLPSMIYSGIEIDSLGVRANGQGSEFEIQAGLVSLESGVLSMGRTYVDGKLEDHLFDLDFLSYDGDETLVHVHWNISNDSDTLQLRIDPKNLIFNKKEWEISPENSIRYGSGWIDFQKFELIRNNQRLLVSSDLEDITNEHIGIDFQEFRLGTFTSLLNPDSLIATGFVDGRFVLENPFGATGILADLKINELAVFEVPLGNFSLDAESVGDASYNFLLALKDGGIDFDLEGDYTAAETGAELNLNFDLNELRADVLQGMLAEQLRDGEGSISGNAKVSGTTANPIYEGEFSFNDFGITINAINSKYTVANETVRLNNEGVYLDDFTVNDQGGNTFVISGSVGTEELANPSFDLRLVADNFRVLNSTREDNELFFGRGIIDANLDIKGDLNLPRVNARLKVKSGTELTFIIPETQLDIVERDGVVLFVNRQDPDDILTRRDMEVGNTGLTGYQLAAVLEVDPDASFNIIIDERSGDNLLVSGEANLTLNFDPNGRITLTGSYELTGGHYEMSLYNLVSRRFEIQEGSTITWAGDPLDASLNMVALYRVRTSAAELMAAQTSGMGAEANAQYNQELPFLVYLNIDGNLTRLSPSFRLDMPEQQRGAAGGNVYGQIQMLNNQEGELNRQVFSLMVLNRFFPDRGGDGGGGGAAGIARSSVSQLLSGQLNSLSDNVLGKSGIDLDFDLDTFTDYQTGAPQDRTQLNVNASSRFMDDRLIVQVGSQIDIEGSSQTMDRGNALLGNVSIEYLLTENGRYRLRAFRKNQFESFIDGQLVITGMSVIFNREFNKFPELWKGIERQRKSVLNAIKEDEEGKDEPDEIEEGNDD
ncbi:translocation/assembly module TamB domain-containing protein [Lunatibacter salilacus]|uniref:translocation/assembly module TamB domain-containing protein n=1 Tax=Lunatibacter salilacus TaxID=2483804 RepID=UPI00131B0EF9|nr:translocation/assembly module TamB [Lunatibacter salilacus]